MRLDKCDAYTAKETPGYEEENTKRDSLYLQGQKRN